MTGVCCVLSINLLDAPVFVYDNGESSSSWLMVHTLVGAPVCVRCEGREVQPLYEIGDSINPLVVCC